MIGILLGLALCAAGAVVFICGRRAIDRVEARATAGEEALRKSREERIHRLERELFDHPVLVDVTSDLDHELGIVDLGRVAPGAFGSYASRLTEYALYGERRKPRP